MIKNVLILIITTSTLYTISCSSFQMSGKSGIVKLLYKAKRNIITAESIEDISRQKKLFSNALHFINQAKALSVKMKKRSGLEYDILTVFAFYYFSVGDLTKAEEFINKSAGDSVDNIVLESRIKLTRKGKLMASKVIDKIKGLKNKIARHSMGHLTLGDAYFYNFNYTSAKNHYTKVLQIGKAHQVLAAERIELIQKIEKIKLRSALAQKLILSKNIKRQDIAHLFFSILKIHRFFRIRNNNPIPFKDHFSSPYKKEIDTLYAKGMFSYIKGDKFDPLKIITRGELAKLIEDFTVLATGNIDNRNRYKRSKKNEINDISTSDSYYNAYKLVTKRKIMNVTLSGYLKPKEPINGLDTLLITKRMIRRIVFKR